MVVLAASICTRGGKALISRQFRDISKDRITALLAYFPSLISNSTSQHTSVEDDNVRYVYQPLEEFYIVLITNKSSNILQDIDTLHLFASTISNLLRNIDERELFENAFDIIDAFDEVINLGYKENLTISQVSTFLEMDSHEEKIQEIIERNKELEATEERKRRAKEIQRKELARQHMSMGGPGSSDFGYGMNKPSIQPTYQPTPTIETAHESKSNFTSSTTSASGRPRGGGLQLGKKPTKSVPGHAMLGKGTINEPLLSNQPLFTHHSQQQLQKQTSSTSVSKSASPAAPQTQRIVNNGILITINEKVNAKLTREGSITSSEVKGDLQLRINDSSLANCRLLLKIHDKADKKQFKIHPNVDRNLVLNENIIVVKDKSKTFRSDDQATGIFKWRYVGKSDDTSSVPLLITAWVNIDDNSQAQVTLEYELAGDFVDAHKSNGGFSVCDVKILVPVVNHDLSLSENELISYDILEQTGTVFTISKIDLEEPSGSFEFSVPIENAEEGEESLFPMELQYDIINTELVEGDVSLGGISITDVVTNDDEEKSLPFELHSNIISDSYIVQ